MELHIFLRNYRKNKKLSVRAFAEMLNVNNYRLEKWEKGVKPNYEDGIKIKRFFGVKDLNNFSEDFLKNYDESKRHQPSNDILSLKDQLLEEKDKRINNLEVTVNMLMEELAEYKTKKKS